MCNLPGTAERCTGLDGEPSGGEPVFPRIHMLAATVSNRKASVFAWGQYFGRCEFVHSRACWIGSRGGKIERSLSVVGKFSIRPRHRQNAGYFGYIILPSSVRLKANVLGRM